MRIPAKRWRPAINSDGSARQGAQIVELRDVALAGVPSGTGSVASMFEGRPARMLAGTPVAGADRETTRDEVGGADRQPRQK
jgi:hypothetical protein